MKYRGSFGTKLRISRCFSQNQKYFNISNESIYDQFITVTWKFSVKWKLLQEQQQICFNLEWSGQLKFDILQHNFEKQLKFCQYHLHSDEIWIVYRKQYRLTISFFLKLFWLQNTYGTTRRKHWFPFSITFIFVFYLTKNFNL